MLTDPVAENIIFFGKKKDYSEAIYTLRKANNIASVLATVRTSKEVVQMQNRQIVF